MCSLVMCRLLLGRFTALKSSLHWLSVKRIKKQLKKPSTAGREGHWMMRCRVIRFYRRSPKHLSIVLEVRMQGHHKSFNSPLSGVDNCCNRLGLRFDKPYQTILGQGCGLGAHRVRSNTYRPNCFGLWHLPVLPPADTI